MRKLPLLRLLPLRRQRLSKHYLILYNEARIHQKMRAFFCSHFPLLCPTGRVMTTLSSICRSETISTVGWPKGIYIVKVTIGKEEQTEKVLVK